VLFGWAAATVIVFAATLTVHTLQHRPPLRVAFNTAVFALATAAGGIAISPINGESLAASVGAVHRHIERRFTEHRWNGLRR